MQMGEFGYIPAEVSMTSLKNKHMVQAAESKTSIQFALTQNPSMRDQLNKSPLSTRHGDPLK